jgi:hypothetical protein
VYSLCKAYTIPINLDQYIYNFKNMCYSAANIAKIHMNITVCADIWMDGRDLLALV